MHSAICTLFEGNYHYGLGALANSLFAQGFRGTIYAGYRGPLPPWARAVNESSDFAVFSPVDGLTFRFIPLETKHHPTNCKPEFMLDLFEKHCPQADALFYFDPDITVRCRWTFFEEWLQAGVAVCADVNHCLPANGPKRFFWRQFCLRHGASCARELDLYFNGGFLGVHRKDIEFLHKWHSVQEWMAPEIGGLQNVNVGDGTFPFRKTDQDALNIAAMICDAPISPMGPSGMDFQPGGGGWLMSHAVGNGKPWNKSFLWRIVRRGAAPSRADKEYFKNVKYPIELYSSTRLAFSLFGLEFTSALGRVIGCKA